MLLPLTFADDLQQFLDLELESSYDFEEGKYRMIPTHLSIVFMQLYMQQIIFQHQNFLCWHFSFDC
jgi:hypothetical protein